MNQSSGIFPPIVKNLLIINGLFFLATYTFQTSFGIDLAQILGLHYWGAENFSAYQFFTYLFMHGGMQHLFFNMFALWMFGRVIENVWGPKRFLKYYLITGVGAALIHYIVIYVEIQPVISIIQSHIDNPDYLKIKGFIESPDFIMPKDFRSETSSFIREFNNLHNENPDKALLMSVDYITRYREAFLNSQIVVGASGAVYGILLAFGMMFPNALLYLFFAIPVKAKYVVIGFGVFELVSGITSNSNVAHFAHLGGMLFGFILIWYWKKQDSNKNQWN